VTPRPLLAVPVAALLLAGCVAQDGFPSLAMRPAELDLSTEEPVHPAVEVPTDPALRARIADLLRQASEGERGFAAALGPAEAAVAAAGGVGSESWVEAQQALSRLETRRAPTARALAELDQLSRERAEMATNAEDFAALDAAVAEAGRIAAGQEERLDRLQARLPSP
jgi:hypothetical protein